MKKTYQGMQDKSKAKFEVLGKRDLLEVPLPMVEVWEELQAQVEQLTGAAGLRIIGTILENEVTRRAPLLSLVFLIQFPWKPMRALTSALPSYLGVASEVNSMGIPAVPFSGLALVALGAAISITVPLFILNAMIIVPLGQIVGGYLENAPRGIFAYSVNILGSLGGILLFTLLCQY